MIDINHLVDQQSLEEERDKRIYGDNEFDYMGAGPIKTVDEEGDAW